MTSRPVPEMQMMPSTITAPPPPEVEVNGADEYGPPFCDTKPPDEPPGPVEATCSAHKRTIADFNRSPISPVEADVEDVDESGKAEVPVAGVASRRLLFDGALLLVVAVLLLLLLLLLLLRSRWLLI